jgi:hypothetical protein
VFMNYVLSIIPLQRARRRPSSCASSAKCSTN